MTTLTINPGKLKYDDLIALMTTECDIEIEEYTRKNIGLSHSTVMSILEKGEVVYGINTGFGKLANQVIESAALAKLQRNLVLSHATGTGKYLSNATSRLIFAMKLNSLCRGYSGVSIALVDHMVKMFNHGIIPLIPEKGSVGASGDLVPLAHLALAVIGEGDVRFKGRIMPAREVLQKCNLQPFELGPKEGLALLNGMQVSNAMVFDAILQFENLFKHAIMCGAMTLDAACGSDAPFHFSIHQIRGHSGQCLTADWYSKWLVGSEIRESHRSCNRVQDPYSLRCQPQVMGACLQQLQFVSQTILTEANGVSDNPIVIPETQEIVSGGNFHGEIVSMAADNLALAIAEVGALSERRVALLIDQSISGLPAFLVNDGGINSGFMIAHVTAAACASDNKALAHPHCVDSLPTSANQEDHVSMATNGARRLNAMLDNTLTILAVELLAACQGLEYRKPLKTSPALQSVYDKVRSQVAAYDQDRYFAPDIEAIKQLILTENLVENFDQVFGKVIEK